MRFARAVFAVGILRGVLAQRGRGGAGRARGREERAVSGGAPPRVWERGTAEAPRRLQLVLGRPGRRRRRRRDAIQSPSLGSCGPFAVGEEGHVFGAGVVGRREERRVAGSRFEEVDGLDGPKIEPVLPGRRTGATVSPFEAQLSVRCHSCQFMFGRGLISLSSRSRRATAASDTTRSLQDSELEVTAKDPRRCDPGERRRRTTSSSGPRAGSRGGR